MKQEQAQEDLGEVFIQILYQADRKMEIFLRQARHNSGYRLQI